MSRVGLIASVLLAGCATSSVTNGDAIRTDGLGSDLRIFLDDACLPQQSSAPASIGPFGFAGATLGEIAVGAGEIAFRSFGRFLEEAGRPDITSSTGVTSSLFYSGNPSSPGYGDLARDIRCIHVVRNGFEPSPSVPATFQPYAHLGLTSEPSLYAVIRLDPADDRSAFFRGSLVHMQANRFERVGGELSRDVAISLGFGSPLDGSGNNFATSVLQLPGLERGRTLSDVETNGLVTVWMNAPPRPEDDQSFAFNLYVDVVESKRGNPFLADIGRLLQSDQIVASARQDIAEVVDGDRSRAQRNTADNFARRAKERSLRRDLEDRIRVLENIVKDGFASEDDRILAIRGVEDAIDEVDYQRDSEGWETPGIDALTRRANTLISNTTGR